MTAELAHQGTTLRLDFQAQDEKERDLAVTLAEEFLDRLIPHPVRALPTPDQVQSSADVRREDLELLRGLTVMPNGFTTRKS